MISGRNEHFYSACFDEVNDVVEALLESKKDPRQIVFNAHAVPVLPMPGRVIYNFENMPPVDPSVYVGHEEIWDFSKANAELQGYEYVPIGYHPKFERFAPCTEQDIDVVFFGCLNERRAKIINELKGQGLEVRVLDNVFGKERDEVLARSKIALNVLYYPDGNFPVLRAAHCVANRLPILTEKCSGIPEWIAPRNDDMICSFEDIPDWFRNTNLKKGCKWLSIAANNAYEAFKRYPMKLPARSTWRASTRTIAKGETSSPLADSFPKALMRWDVINHIAKKINAQRYLEIGVADGTSMRNVQIEEKWGVDPNPTIEGVRACNVFCPHDSDYFFKSQRWLRQYFDIIFIDGDHRAEQAQKDIANAINFLSDNGVIVLHDCNPTTKEMQIVPAIQGEWTGDVWKEIARLRQNTAAKKQIGVINSDYGIGIIVYSRGKQNQLQIPLSKPLLDFQWTDLVSNRKEILGLLEPHEWIHWFDDCLKANFFQPV